MGVDHVVDLDCLAKRTLGVANVVARLKDRSRAEAVLALARNNGDVRPPDQITFRVAVQRPEGASAVDVSVGSLLDAASVLDPYRPSCRGCPANVAATDFGCIRYIGYPFQRATEQWLWSRLPRDPHGVTAQLLMRAILDFGWDGSPVARMRAQGQTYFESPVPLVGRWPNGIAFTSDQLFHMLFHVGHLQPAHTSMLAFFLGALPASDPAVLSDRGRRTQALAQAEIPPAPGQAEELACFLRAAIVAARLDVPLLVDG